MKYRALQEQCRQQQLLLNLQQQGSEENIFKGIQVDVMYDGQNLTSGCSAFGITHNFMVARGFDQDAGYFVTTENEHRLCFDMVYQSIPSYLRWQLLPLSLAARTPQRVEDDIRAIRCYWKLTKGNSEIPLLCQLGSQKLSNYKDIYHYLEMMESLFGEHAAFFGGLSENLRVYYLVTGLGEGYARLLTVYHTEDSSCESIKQTAINYGLF